MPTLSKNISLEHLLEELVRMPTVSTDQAANKEALDWIAWQLGTLPLHIKTFEQNGFHSLFITTRETMRPKLLLLAHIDVVPGGYQAFEPTVRQRRLYGRGAYDMKFALACYLRLMHDLGDDLPRYDLGVMINTDEEVGGLDGAAAMLAAGYGAEIVLNPDGGADWAIERGAKGYHEVVVESFGKSAHGGYPWLGKNAITQLMAYLDDLAKVFPFEPCGDDAHAHDVMNVGMITGGEASNVVPSQASATLTLRSIPGETAEDIKNRLGEVRSRHKNIQISYKFGNSALEVDIRNPHLETYAGLVRRATGREPRYIIAHAASDARYFAVHHIPVIVSKPVGGTQHGDDEWIDLASLDKYYGVVRQFVELSAREKTT